MAKKSTNSRLHVEELTWPGKKLSDSLVDYDGASLSEPRLISPLPNDQIDATTCLFPFAVKVDVSARFPKGERYVPCGHCEDCLRRNRNQWFFRIKQEAKLHLSNLFVTLTYDDKSLLWDGNGNPMVDKSEISIFMRKLRKKIAPHRIRYFGISEYGPKTFRPHYHIILFGWPVDHDAYSVILDVWNKAENITISQLNDEQIMYCCRYHTDKGFTPRDYQRTFTFMSKQPGIGACYADDPAVRSWHHADPQRALYGPLEAGGKTSLGRYLRNRIYGKDFECPPPKEQVKDLMTRDERYHLYYAKKSKRRAKLVGKV